MTRPPTTLLIACGALAQEITALIRVNRWDHLTLTCLPAQLHNRPDKITDAVRQKITAARGHYDRILVVYGDCGTGGRLDAMLAEEGIERIAGPHCYQFYAGAADFAAMMEAEPGTFFLTDYLVRHFELLMIKGLGLDRHPRLRDEYFRNYSKLVYLAQTEDAALREQAEAAAARLGLAFEYRYTGYGELEHFMADAKRENRKHGKADHRLLA
ncbi:MAG: DUF1638 domain-containing protein [Proteobacteria bacterium]|nr:DUF1638 domain-containing protein [Pseudomonadota bacterium]